MRRPVTVNDLLDGHVALDIECMDRLYLNAYVPNLQVGGQIVTFLTRHLGFSIPSPAVFDQIGQRFRTAVARFAADNRIPVIRFTKGQRKLDVVRPLMAAAAATGRGQVVAIGTAQEFQYVSSVRSWKAPSGSPQFAFDKANRRVSVFYFYLWDAEMGPAFFKICTYFPYPCKIWINAHEWAKRQLVKAGIGFTELSNGFASCEDPAVLQAVCDRFGPGVIKVFCERWWARLPLPFTRADRAAGYWWDISMRQVEVSRTIVFDKPRHARGFFEALIADNLDLGRPDQVEIIFGRKIRTTTPGVFRTAIDRHNQGVCVNVFYKHSRIKQYLKDGRALRIETVVNDTGDLGVLRRIEHLPEIWDKGRDCNRRLLDAERVGQSCVLASPAFERLAQPTLTEDGRKAPALRFGDPRVMALAGVLCGSLLAVTGFTNKSLRALMAGLMATPFTPAQMSYDLRRLRLNGLITRIPHTNTYVLTPDGTRAAIFYTKVHDRLLRPLLADTHPPPELRRALHIIDTHIDDFVADARLPSAA